jgi:hypothetical protein
MAERVEIICFAASYAIALALELTRLFYRSALRGVLIAAFVGAGLFAQTLFLVHRSRLTAVPLSSAFDWYLMAGWGLVVIYLYLWRYHAKSPMGLFILPLVLLLIAAGTFLAGREPFAVNVASRYWGSLHGAFLLLGTISVMAGFVAGVMYLIQAYRLKHKRPPLKLLQLPSLEWLAQFNARAIVLSLIMLTVGVLSGTVLNVINHGRKVDELPWNDPVVLTSALTVGWLFVMVVFALVYKPARQGRKVAYLTVASFVLLVVSLSASLLLNSQHTRPSRSATGASPGAAGPAAVAVDDAAAMDHAGAARP